jgi:Leucine-rich repeat (LRR) protein/protein tyrosine phosphatase (PTP) superfamily phosphohydrolase (DUF442 family)
MRSGSPTNRNGSPNRKRSFDGLERGDIIRIEEIFRKQLIERQTNTILIEDKGLSIFYVTDEFWNKLQEDLSQLKPKPKYGQTEADRNESEEDPDAKLPEVESLNISSNNLTAKDIFSLERFPNMVEFKAHSNNIRSVPSGIENFTKLQRLDLSNNNIATLKGIESLTTLIRLNCGKNRIETLPDKLGNLQKLKYLRLGANNLTKVKMIMNLSTLLELDLNSNKLTKIPRSIGNLINLERLELNNNKLTAIPSEIGTLTSLNYFNISNNQLVKLPDEIGLLTNLQDLILKQNKLICLPDKFSAMKSLRRIFAEQNKITELPISISEVESLTELDVSDNQLANVDQKILDLFEKNLQSLNISHNNITMLPQVKDNHLTAVTKRQIRFQFHFNFFIDAPLPLHHMMFTESIPDKVLDHLFISNALAASNQRALKTLGITHVICAAFEEDATKFPGITHKVMNWNDAHTQLVLDHLEIALKFIEGAVNKGGKVLVHCQAGISRSATIVISWLMYAEKMRFKQALQYVKERRPIVNPNIGFTQQLLQYEDTLFKEK